VARFVLLLAAMATGSAAGGYLHIRLNASHADATTEKTAARRAQAGYKKCSRTGTFRSTLATKSTETAERPVGVLSLSK
jgi:hypothetical protein